MKLNTLNDLLVLKLKALYDIETQLVKALPKMAKAATDPDLKKGFEQHLKETKNQAVRLEKVFKLLKLKPGKTKVEAIRGLVADTEWIIKKKPSKLALDAMLIASSSYVEHYEMAGYMTASDWAETLGFPEVALVLRETLKEEEVTADKLSMLAEKKIDERAMNEER
jgi:ferritin-like metal-binding protein YciE